MSDIKYNVNTVNQFKCVQFLNKNFDMDKAIKKFEIFDHSAVAITDYNGDFAIVTYDEEDGVNLHTGENKWCVGMINDTPCVYHLLDVDRVSKANGYCSPIHIEQFDTYDSAIEYMAHATEIFEPYESTDEQTDEYVTPLDTEGLILLTTLRVSKWNEMESIGALEQQDTLHKVIEKHLDTHPVAIHYERVDLENHKDKIEFTESFVMEDFYAGNDLKNGMDIYLNEETENLTIFIYGGGYTRKDNPTQQHMEISKCEFYLDEERNDTMVDELLETKERLILEVNEKTDWEEITMR